LFLSQARKGFALTSSVKSWNINHFMLEVCSVDLIDFSKGDGLAPAIIQDAETGDVLMLGYMSEASLKKTVETGKACFFSRSRQQLWVKGETSGHIQKVKEIFVDCDRDTILVKVEQVGGAACHTGYRSCFYQRLEDDELKTVGERVFDPKEVYGE
jgi:phosphoribosyl-AMP cyclohydrolase